MPTIREALAARYPLHFQRIVEAVHEQPDKWMGPNEYLDGELQSLHVLTCAFVWSLTDEGHSYWSALSRAEDGP